MNGSPKSPEVENLGLYQNDRWLFRGLNLEMPAGKLIALTGPSGVGKSSLLHVIAGLLPPTEGIVHQPLTEHPPRPLISGSGMGVIFQKLRLIPNHSVLQNVLCGRLGRYPWWKTFFSFPRQDRLEALERLQSLQIDHLASHWVCETSGGEQQRAAIARTLHQNPQWILADEPVAHLDQDLAHRSLALLKEQTRLHSSTMLCALHQQELISKYADRILELSPSHPQGWRLISTTS
jgi:phosphonate transport system ATP-binding protein